MTLLLGGERTRLFMAVTLQYLINKMWEKFFKQLNKFVYKWYNKMVTEILLRVLKKMYVYIYYEGEWGSGIQKNNKIKQKKKKVIG